MKLFQSINQMRKSLPVERKNRSFVETLTDEFKNYIELVNQIEKSEFEMLIGALPQNDKTTKNQIVNSILRIQQTILSIIDSYYEGYPIEHISYYKIYY